MGVYVYTITRKSRKISGRDIHTVKFAYKCGGSMFDIDSKGRTREERLDAKIVRPTERAWERAGGVRGALVVWEYEDGAPVYAAKGASFYDTGEPGELVGHIRQSGESAKFRFDPVTPRPYRVTFHGELRYENGRHVGLYPSVTRVVVASNPDRAKGLVLDLLDREGFDRFTISTRHPEIVVAS